MNDFLSFEITFILFSFHLDENSETEKAFKIVMIKHFQEASITGFSLFPAYKNLKTI